MTLLAATALTQVIPQHADYIRILPELVLAIFGMVVMALDPLLGERATQKTLGAVGLVGTLAALGATAYMAQVPGLAFWDMIRVDTFSVFFHFVVITVAAITILTSHEYMAVAAPSRRGILCAHPFRTLGMALMSSAVELVLIFVALEISSIATYILAGFRRRFAISGESFAQIFPARIIRHCIFPLWRRAHVWRNRIDERADHRSMRCETVRYQFLLMLRLP